MPLPLLLPEGRPAPGARKYLPHRIGGALATLRSL